MRSTLTELKKWEIIQLWILYQWIKIRRKGLKHLYALVTAETFSTEQSLFYSYQFSEIPGLIPTQVVGGNHFKPFMHQCPVSDFVHRAKRCGKENCEGVWVGSFLLSPSRYLPPYFFSALWLCAVLHHLNAQNRLMHLLNIYPWLCGQRLRKNSRDSCHTVWNYILIFFWK